MFDAADAMHRSHFDRKAFEFDEHEMQDDRFYGCKGAQFERFKALFPHE